MRTQRRRDPSWCPDMVALTSQEETAMLSLSDTSRPLIEATLPVVGEHIEEIAEHFYRHLFTAHPELLDGTFNRGNQLRAVGPSRQVTIGRVNALMVFKERTCFTVHYGLLPGLSACRPLRHPRSSSETSCGDRQEAGSSRHFVHHRDYHGEPEQR